MDAHGESEQATAFLTVLEECLALPFGAVVLGETVVVEKLDLSRADEPIAILSMQREASEGTTVGSRTAGPPTGRRRVARGVAPLVSTAIGATATETASSNTDAQRGCIPDRRPHADVGRGWNGASCGSGLRPRDLLLPRCRSGWTPWLRSSTRCPRTYARMRERVWAGSTYVRTMSAGVRRCC